ncbi:DUF3999 family protein [Pseudoduganella armeniaca]|uniref:DUF3999 domain-containing protein n=1 Tax=Pseudoduganella armeniaca TaxID=2072590 RepID=A0A2R4C8U7_9BURK|nr:DUF3999 family protein [Pseudoduganella armeniaca]AVR96026.1 DUF3999 domain-containing protein [Pseudoduganella armeniaca]
MRHSMISGVALAWLALGGAAPLYAATTDKADAYAWRQTLSTSGREAVVQYRLPASVYLHARSARLDDVRVFDSRGTVLPFALRQPAEQAQASRHSVPVRVFPVFGAPGDSAASTAIDIRRTPDGALVSLGTRGTPRADAPLAALVLDMRPDQQRDPQAPGTFDMLRFTLPAGTQRYQALLAVEVSDDLKSWRELAQSQVSWMVSGDGAALAADRLEFAPREFRYARIRWLEGQPLQFATVTAEAVQYSGQAAPLDSLVLPPTPGKNPGEWLYAASSAIPVQRIGLELAERNVSLPVELGRYTELPALKGRGATTWRFDPALKATFYRIEQGGRERRSGDLAIEPTHQPHWVVRPLTPTDSKPALRIGWAPATLVFLTSGHGPYTLAYGRDDAAPATRDLGEVAPGLSAAEIGKAEQVTAGPEQATPRAQESAASAAEQAAAASRYRKAALWAALLADWRCWEGWRGSCTGR